MTGVTDLLWPGSMLAVTRGRQQQKRKTRVLLNICYAGQPESYGSDVWKGGVEV